MSAPLTAEQWAATCRALAAERDEAQRSEASLGVYVAELEAKLAAAEASRSELSDALNVATEQIRVVGEQGRERIAAAVAERDDMTAHRDALQAKRDRAEQQANRALADNARLRDALRRVRPALLGAKRELLLEVDAALAPAADAKEPTR